MTAADVELAGRKAILRQDGKTLAAEILSPEDAAFQLVSTTPPRPQAQNEGTRKLAIRLEGCDKTVCIAVLLTPTDTAPPEYQKPEIRPLERWHIRRW